MNKKIDHRHFAIKKLDDHKWYALRPLEQSDLSGIHMQPIPDYVCNKRTQHYGEWVAADLLTTPIDISIFDKAQINLGYLDENINREIAFYADNPDAFKGLSMSYGIITIPIKANVVVLFEKFLKKDKELDYAYRCHLVEELLTQREELKEKITANEAAYKEEKDEEEIKLLQDEYERYTSSLGRMDNVLAFIGSAATGILITKVVSTLEWEYQEPVYYTESDELADSAFDFFNAYAVITANQE